MHVGAAEEPVEDRHQAIATAMTRYKREIPRYYLDTTLSIEPTLRWLQDTSRAFPPPRRIRLASLPLTSVALVLAAFPEPNGPWEEEAFRAAEDVHPGLAISLRGGRLVAPAIHDVSGKSPVEVSTTVRDVVHRSRSGRRRGSEVTDPTITATGSPP